MRRSRLLSVRRARLPLALAALLAQLVAATGAPLPRARGARDAIPFPCQGHPCGCSTADRGWAGDCCCFTLEQKLAWADARGVEPPPHVRPTVAARKAAAAAESCRAKPQKSNKSCCAGREPADEPPAARPAPKVEWVVGVFARKCRGEGPGGLLKAEAGVAPDLPPAPRAGRNARHFARAADAHARPATPRPPVPPPRLS